MKITKYEHACLVVEKDGQKVVVDPGAYTTSLGTPEGVVAIVITHEHQDHFLLDHVKRIIEANPDAQVLAHDSLKDDLAGLPFQAVMTGTGINVGAFHFEFFGDLHTQVHPSIPQVPNLGVMIDDHLYYPGDSYTVPTKLVTILALPANGPWAKFSQTVDYLMELKPKVAFPTHDAFLSEAGDGLVDHMIGGFAAKVGTEYNRLAIGEPVEL